MAALPSTVVDYIHHEDRVNLSRRASHLSLADKASSVRDTFTRPASTSEAELVEEGDSNEFRLPAVRSLFVVIFGNVLFQIMFFIIVSSASAYAEYLGGSATFSGLTIGIPPVFGGLALLVTTRFDRGQYKACFQLAYASAILGNILYALAYKAHFLYLILIGRCVSGVAFISFMYSKRYCADPRIVGIRRRTTLASWLVVGQGLGFSAGPFLGGVLYKIGFADQVFNGYTSPGWIMTITFALFWVIGNLLFKDIPPLPKATSRADTSQALELDNLPPNPSRAHSHTDLIPHQSSPPPTTQSPHHASWRDLSFRQWGVTLCMCYFAMTCFLILGAWESNIPVYTSTALDFSPFKAGNFIALGGVATLPFLLANVRYARRFQDRTTLALGTTLGIIGITIMLILLSTSEQVVPLQSGSHALFTPNSPESTERIGKVAYVPFLICWFLVALGFNLASTCTLSLLSKQLPDEWYTGVSMAIQYSNYTGRTSGAILGGAGVKIGMKNYLAVQLAIVGFGVVMYCVLWRDMKAKKG
ncbi:MFS general substrate transporter [Coprinopsis marcescibilis]|uniref:MFS general substrate transporter n=1 Tax=Coprinopsis marcescibilis TaxID=230819 RepID=A0A5C3L6T0_COPMA|nr:MFS general substrate transporter [Coprinopsis marcescibilis]